MSLSVVYVSLLLTGISRIQVYCVCDGERLNKMIVRSKHTFYNLTEHRNQWPKSHNAEESM